MGGLTTKKNFGTKNFCILKDVLNEGENTMKNLKS
jgi:hypothetical protein